MKYSEAFTKQETSPLIKKKNMSETHLNPPMTNSTANARYDYSYYAPPPPPTMPLPRKPNTILEQPPPPAEELTSFQNVYAPPPPPPLPITHIPTHMPPPPVLPLPTTNEQTASQVANDHVYNYTFNYYANYYDYSSYYQSTSVDATAQYNLQTDQCYYKNYPINTRAKQQSRYEGRKMRYDTTSTFKGYTAIQEKSEPGVRRNNRDHERDHGDGNARNYSKPETERERLLKTWRSNFCETPEDIAKKLSDLAKVDVRKGEVWVRSSPSDLFYKRTDKLNEVVATPRLEALCKLFDEELVQRAGRIRARLPAYVPPPRKTQRRFCKHKLEACSSSSDSEHDDDELKIEQDYCMEELSRKLQHPQRIHSDLWHNDPGDMNDGPLCRCSAKSKRIGIRHGIYPGEDVYEKCEPLSNNANRLYHYTISISPPTNFLTKTPTIIKHDEHEFLFEGFSLLSHMALVDLPTCKVIRFNIEYTIIYTEEKMPELFSIQELDLFSECF